MAFEHVFKNIDNALGGIEQARGTFYSFQRNLYKQAI